ncbi:MAG TPA: GDSL-type esterase/lipase family protein [Acidimicrobiia bacterium]|nr:GDSL-type esterase/lipase family protein [Acidimicrobiia bacterium]
MMPRRRRSALVCALAACIAVGTTARVGAVPPLTGPLPTCSVPCISVGDASVLEGDSGTRNLVFPVTLSKPATSAVSVQYRIVNGSAIGSTKHISGIDFNSNGVIKTLSFPVLASGATVTSKSISVPVWGDTAIEPDETFRVLLSNPTGGARFSRPAAIGTIFDDDSSGAGTHIGVGDASLVEGNAGNRQLSFPISLSSSAASAVTLNYAITSTSAQWGAKATVPGADFGGKTSGTIKFPLGANGTPVLKRLPIPVWPDANSESDETITLTISGTLPPGVTITRASATGTIIDDDGTPTSEPVPNSMAALGDSMSRGFNACPTFGECVASNWSTGTDPAVDSQYSRILAVNPAISGHVFNDAVSGATESNLVGQATNAVNQGVDYITIEMGGNDACKQTEAQMTSVANYQSQFQAALNTIATGLPNARVFVASVPDIKQLWFVGKDNANARNVWSTFGICQSMVANPQSTAPADVDRRDRVQQRVIDYNTALATVCAQFTHCRFDNNLIFDTKFELSDVSSADYFHPSLSGQTELAIGTYGVGWNW